MAFAQHRGVVRGLHLVEMLYEFLEIIGPGKAGQKTFDVVFDALLAAGHAEQLVVQRDIPVPVETVFGEGLVERLAVPVLGIGKRAVHVEYDGSDGHG